MVVTAKQQILIVGSFYEIIWFFPTFKSAEEKTELKYNVFNIITALLTDEWSFFSYKQ